MTDRILALSGFVCLGSAVAALGEPGQRGCLTGSRLGRVRLLGVSRRVFGFGLGLGPGLGLGNGPGFGPGLGPGVSLRLHPAIDRDPRIRLDPWGAEYEGSIQIANGRLPLDDPEMARRVAEDGLEGPVQLGPEALAELLRSSHLLTLSGPGGTGNAVHISGYEAWTISAQGLIQESKGHFDAAEYDRQLIGN